MTRPTLHTAVAEKPNKASEYNENFTLLMDYLEDTCEAAVATVTNKANKDLSNVTGLTATITELNYCDGVTSNIQTQLNAKASSSAPAVTAVYLKTTYVSGTSGYNIWSNGYCEQWGRASGYQGATAYFLKTMANTNYYVNFVVLNTNSQDQSYIHTATELHTTYVGFSDYLIRDTLPVSWIVKGYLASGQY